MTLTEKPNWAILLPVALIFVGVPVLGGIATIYLRTSQRTTLVAGLLLWLGQMLAVYVYSRRTSKEPVKVSVVELLPRLLMSLMSFGMAYGLTIIFLRRVQ